MLDVVLQYASRGWPVFPVSVYKTPFRGSHGLLDATTDLATITRWWTEKPNANIGLATGRIVVIDPDGPEALERLTAIGAAHGGWPRTLTAETPRGHHLYYLALEGVEIRSYNEPRAKKGAPGIDIKGAGGYVVLPPSKTKGGQYQWLIEVPLTVLPDWAVAWYHSLKGVREQTGNISFGSTPLPDYLAKAKANNQQNQTSITKRASAALGDPWSEQAEDRIKSALNAIPATGYDRWITVGMALASLDWDRPDGTSIGFELFDDWSATQPELYSLDGTEKKWASFGRNGRGGVTLGSLFHLAEEHGWQGLIPPAASEPHPFFMPTVQLNGHASAADLIDPEIKDTRSLIELNHRYACIGDVGGKCLVMGWVPSKVDAAVETPSFQTFKSFSERFGNKYVLVNKEKKDGATEEESKQLGAYWLKWRRRHSYEGIDLIPNAPRILPNNALNLWRGFAVPSQAGAWPLLQKHIAEVLADSNAAALDYIVKWSAWAVQNPGERAESALVFRGGKGSGKGTFAHALRRIFGMHGLHIANSKHLVGSFNAHLRNCLLLYADEAFWAGDKQGESTLKSLITEPTLTIEQKGVDAVQWHNRIHLIMTANAEWVVPASHDERRYAMFNVSEKYMGDEKYFEALHNEINGGGLASMLYDLAHLKLGNWHPRHILKTQALTEQKIQSMTPLQEWWEAMLQEASIPAAPKDAPDCAMAVYLLNHAKDFATRLKDLTPTRLGRFLSDRGCIKLHRATGNAWRFPELPKARTDWERYYQGWRWEHAAGQWAVKQ